MKDSSYGKITGEVPTQQVTRKMIRISVRITIMRVMKLQDFHFDGTIYRLVDQLDQITGVVKDVCIEEWDKRLTVQRVKAQG